MVASLVGFSYTSEIVTSSTGEELSMEWMANQGQGNRRPGWLKSPVGMVDMETQRIHNFSLIK